jgi:hypothetical protein
MKKKSQAEYILLYPFTEPSQLYTNVDRGSGIFASYTINLLVSRVKKMS